MKRIKRVISDDEDSEKEEETEGQAQERIANELFEGDDDVEEDDDDARSRMTRAETEARDLAVEGSDEEDGMYKLYKNVLNVIYFVSFAFYVYVGRRDLKMLVIFELHDKLE